MKHNLLIIFYEILQKWMKNKNKNANKGTIINKYSKICSSIMY